MFGDRFSQRAIYPNTSTMSKPFTPILLSTVAIASSLLMPVAVNAQSSPQPIVCHVSISLWSGANNIGPKLTYRLAGTMPQQTSEKPQNPVGNSLQITVQEQNDQIKTFLKRATLNDYATIAPDADYAKLPFTGEFKAKSNDPRQLYRAPGSTHGLYVSLRPVQGQVNQVQVVHYLSPKKFIRGQGKCSSNVVTKLAPIQAQLDAKNWAAADRETRRIFDPRSVDIRSQDLSKPTAEMIYAIDQAWLEASDGRFGLTPQLWRWKLVRAGKTTDQDATVNAFRDLVGWKMTQQRSEPHPTDSDWRNESELNYSLKAPIGHLPWVGVSDREVLDLGSPDDGESCGSCTIDAMALRSTRFYGHIPQYFEPIEAALNPR
jgi:GUN4-like